MPFGDPVGEFGDIQVGTDELCESGAVVVWPDQVKQATRFGWRVDRGGEFEVAAGFVRLVRTAGERAEVFFRLEKDGASS